jgi:SAM-dependent methyltransferase
MNVTEGHVLQVISIDEARKAPWFHSIDFKPRLDFVSRTRFNENVPPNYTLFGFYDLIRHLDLTKAECLDLGTMDGIAAFIMKDLGAERVVATDIGERKTFLFARESLGLAVDYRPDTDLYNISAKAGQSFDIVLMAGVLYHVFDPLYAVTIARQLTRHNGFAIIETHFLKDEARPIMLFNPADPDAIQQENFFWRASPSCLEAMFIMCGFHVIARRDVGKRVTYLLQAARPSEMTEANDITKRIFASFMRYKHYRENIDYSALERSEGSSVVRLRTVPSRHEQIQIRKYVPSVPFQPRWVPESKEA